MHCIISNFYNLMNINWKKALGLGVLVWIIMFVVYSVLIGYGLMSSEESGWTLWGIVAIIITLLVTYFAARKVAPESYSIAFGYGLVFAVVGIILDYFITIKFAPNVFSSTAYWISYLLLAVTPLSVVKRSSPQI